MNLASIRQISQNVCVTISALMVLIDAPCPPTHDFQSLPRLQFQTDCLFSSHFWRASQEEALSFDSSRESREMVNIRIVLKLFWILRNIYELGHDCDIIDLFLRSIYFFLLIIEIWKYELVVNLIWNKFLFREIEDEISLIDDLEVRNNILRGIRMNHILEN